MKPAHVSAMFLYLFAVQAEHRKSAREIKMAHADARRTPALNLGQTVLGIDDSHCYRCSSPCSHAVCCHGEFPQCCSDGHYCYCCEE
ncbi:hypothetical protein V8F44DRAFT_491212 [Aspergillus fumigatus]